jgi:uncharacterized protein (DUF1800 family)
MADSNVLPSVSAFFALNRLGYGARPGEVTEFARHGFRIWLDEQLKPPPGDDPETAQALENAQLRIKYAAGDPAKNQNWEAIDEMQPLGTLAQPIDALWPTVAERDKHDGAERRRPLLEVISATLIRAVHSQYPLREVMCNFWHDHFNVDAWGSEQVAVALPTYDRDVIRPNCLGNFRYLIESVATSTSMLYYLSNHSSRAGSANENYGRELFELHTLGRQAYLNDKYDRWRDVPGALEGHPSGYIDEDVYESARSFTGWTVEDGSSIDGGRKLPQTGRFAYVENWHDGYQKRVLAADFTEFQPAMADGRRVLDLVASHPATARFVCTKLVRRLVADSPPTALVETATRIWRDNLHAPDQIAKVVRVIALSPEFGASRGAKARRPIALVAGFARTAGLDLMPTEPLINTISGAGQRLYGYPNPTGLPDERAYFLGTNSMRVRWQLMLGLAQNSWNTGAFHPAAVMGQATSSARDAAAFWLVAFTGSADPQQVTSIVDGIGLVPEDTVGPIGSPDTEKRLALIAAYAAMSPGFQSC